MCLSGSELDTHFYSEGQASLPFFNGLMYQNNYPERLGWISYLTHYPTNKLIITHGKT